MKALFIWREESKNYIKRIIGENQFTDGVNFITSQSSFDAFIPKSKENLTTAEKKEETKKENVFKSYTKIYILAELGWDKNKLFDGYEKGFDIIDKWKTKIPPHIEFFSIANQKLVSQSVSDKFRFIVKAFPFTNLLKLDSKYIFNTENMNQYKWDYFSYQILTSYGILDNFSHRLDIINDTNPNFQILLDELVLELSNYSEFVGKTLLDFIVNISYTNKYVFQLKLLIDNRIIEVRGDKIKKINLPKSLKILVVDDNKSDLELITNSLNRYKDNYIKAITSGKEAIELINDKDNLFDIVISDLELLNSQGFYQKKQGVEIFEAVKNSNRMVIGIITGLGRKGIAKLLKIKENNILPKKNLHRFDIDEELDNLLSSLLIDFTKKEKALNLTYGPKKGIINKKGFKTSLSKAFSNEEFYAKTWNDANLIAQKFIEKILKPSEWEKELIKGETKADFDEFIATKLSSLLGQRLIMIFLSVKNNGWIPYCDDKKIYNGDDYDNDESNLEERYIDLLRINEINITKNWISTLCIHYKPEDKNKGFLLSVNNLFPEELVFLNKYQKKFNIEKSKLFISNHSPSTILWIKGFFNAITGHFSDFGVPDDLGNWEYSDLQTVWFNIIKDLKNKKEKSEYFEILDLLLDYSPNVLKELNPILKNFESEIIDLGEISINWGE